MRGNIPQSFHFNVTTLCLTISSQNFRPVHLRRKYHTNGKISLFNTKQMANKFLPNVI